MQSELQTLFPPFNKSYGRLTSGSLATFHASNQQGLKPQRLLAAMHNTLTYALNFNECDTA